MLYNSLPGYTLIEILIVLFIIGIFLFGGYTAFITAKHNQELIFNTEHLVDTLRRAHVFSRNIRDDKEWGVISNDQKKYSMVTRNNSNEISQTLSSYPLSQSVEIVKTFAIWFDKGTGEINAPTEITLQNKNNQKTTIRIEKTEIVSYVSN